MIAVLGKGIQHSKWSPGMAFYKKEPVINAAKVHNPELVAEKCTDGVFELKGRKLDVNQEKVYESNLLEYYAELDKGLSLEYSNNFIFTIESWGQLSCKDILNQCADIIIEKIETLEQQLDI